jgi:hypothetical protein
MSQESVQKVIPFTESDLEANRRFEVTKAQLNHLRSNIDYLFRRAIWGLIISIVSLFLLAASGQLAVLIPRPKNNLQSAPKLLMFFIVLVMIAFVASAFVIFWSLIKYRNYNEKLTVRVVEGKTERFTGEFKNSVKIGDVEFYVEDEIYDAFTGEYYRVYYLDSSDILSVESPETKI